MIGWHKAHKTLSGLGIRKAVPLAQLTWDVMKKRTSIVLILVVGAAAAAAYMTRASWTGGNASAQAPPRIRVVAVELAKAERKPVPVEVDSIGMVTPISSVALKSRVETTILAVHFEDGARVKEGDLLFTLDARQIESLLALSAC